LDVLYTEIILSLIKLDVVFLLEDHIAHHGILAADVSLFPDIDII